MWNILTSLALVLLLTACHPVPQAPPTPRGDLRDGQKLDLEIQGHASAIVDSAVAPEVSEHARVIVDLTSKLFTILSKAQQYIDDLYLSAQQWQRDSKYWEDKYQHDWLNGWQKRWAFGLGMAFVVYEGLTTYFTGSGFIIGGVKLVGKLITGVRNITRRKPKES